MPEEDALTQASSPDHKSRIRHRLREKLSHWDSKGSKDSQSRDQEIQSFLHPASDRRTASATADHINLPPELDSSEINVPAKLTSPSPARRKSPRKLNLHVRFAAAAPLVIGEGGDEAALPVTELLPSLLLSSGTPVEAPEDSHQRLSKNGSETVIVHDRTLQEHPLPPRPLQRRSTGIQDHGLDDCLEQDSPQYRNNSAESHGPLSAPPDETDEDPESPVVVAQSEDSAGVILPTDNETINVEQRTADADWHVPTFRPLQLPAFDPVTSFANSLSPLPSPQPPRPPSISPNLKASLVSSGLDDDQTIVEPDKETHERIPQAPPPHSAQKLAAESRGFSLRSVAKNFSDDALHDFSTRMRPYCNVFLLGLSTRTEPKLQNWILAASWWFFKGRGELESSVRSGTKPPPMNEISLTNLPQDLRQAYVDLAKSWWIIAEMTPARHPEVIGLEHRGPAPVSSIMRSFVDVKTAELVQVHASVGSNLRALTMSMKRNNRLPPPGLELQGLDTRIFMEYPLLSPSAARLLSPYQLRKIDSSGEDKPASFFPMPISDTDQHFNYGRMFVDVIFSPMENEHPLSLPCLLSVLRDKKVRDITIVATSQDGQIHLVIQPKSGALLSWQDVRWKTQQRCIEVDLRADFSVQIQFSDKDFRTLWGIQDYIRTVRKQSQGSKNETLVFENVVRSFQYFEPHKNDTQFPTNAIEGCKLRLFECFRGSTEGAGSYKIHDGFRLMATTPRKDKTLSSVSHNLGKLNPIIFSYLRDEQEAPALLLRLTKSSRDPSMVMSFQREADRELLYSLLNGTQMSRDEYSSSMLRMKSFGVLPDPDHEHALGGQAGILSNLHWKRLQVLGQRRQQLELGGSAMRICTECDMGSIADRIYLGPGELRIRLDCEATTRLEMLRGPQSDMTACFADNTLSKEQYEGLRQMLDYVAQSSTLRIFSFDSLNDLHSFQTLITGFSVSFDGFAKSFAISRRRMVVPIHKRWEASRTRLQVVRHDKSFQLAVFFQEFNHGSCMNFVLKSTDFFESFSRSNTPYLCIVDAKFALPKETTEPSHRFLSLGMPDYPAEHDDITIGFETDQGDEFLLSSH
ncbi:MAG: hypothetical protein Q9219_002265 [cf. Caloplaca sp. 3 TL-2023]